MAAQGRNEGFHVLDEFVCEAIHAPSVPLANPTNQGQNDGMSVVEELVFEVRREATADEPDGRRSSVPVAQDAGLKSMIEPLATYISASRDPRGALVLAIELLLAELNGIDQAATEGLEKLRHGAVPTESRSEKTTDPGTAPDPVRDIGSLGS